MSAKDDTLLYIGQSLLQAVRDSRNNQSIDTQLSSLIDSLAKLYPDCGQYTVDYKKGKKRLKASVRALITTLASARESLQDGDISEDRAALTLSQARDRIAHIVRLLYSKIQNVRTLEKAAATQESVASGQTEDNPGNSVVVTSLSDLFSHKDKFESDPEEPEDPSPVEDPMADLMRTLESYGVYRDRIPNKIPRSVQYKIITIPLLVIASKINLARTRDTVDNVATNAYLFKNQIVMVINKQATVTPVVSDIITNLNSHSADDYVNVMAGEFRSQKYRNYTFVWLLTEQSLSDLRPFIPVSVSLAFDPRVVQENGFVSDGCSAVDVAQRVIQDNAVTPLRERRVQFEEMFKGKHTKLYKCLIESESKLAEVQQHLKNLQPPEQPPVQDRCAMSREDRVRYDAIVSDYEADKIRYSRSKHLNKVRCLHLTHRVNKLRSMWDTAHAKAINSLLSR